MPGARATGGTREPLLNRRGGGTRASCPRPALSREAPAGGRHGHASRKLPRDRLSTPAPRCPAGGAGEARTGLTAAQLRAMTGQPGRVWALGAPWGFLEPRSRRCRLAPSCPCPGLPALGGKVANASAGTLGGPAKSAQPPVTSRVVVHLIGCSAAGVGQLLAAGAPCVFLKPWYCKDPQGRPPVLFYRCGNEPREGKRLMFHQ